LFLLHSVQIGSGVDPASYPMATCMGIKWSGCEAAHSFLLTLNLNTLEMTQVHHRVIVLYRGQGTATTRERKPHAKKYGL
jgi:hypothetical protein